MDRRSSRVLALVAGALIVGGAVRLLRSKPAVPAAEAPVEAAAPAWSGPIAATHLDDGTVLVAGVVGSQVHVRKIGAGDKGVLDGVSASPDAEMKLAAGEGGLALTWRGLRNGKLVRELVRLGPDLAPRGEPTVAPAASCATREAFWGSDGAVATAYAWNGPTTTFPLPKDRDASLLCAAHHAYAMLEAEDRTEILPLEKDATPTALVRESELGDDEQRELSEYTVGDDVGIVRLGASGAITMREWSKRTAGPLRKLRTAVGHDDDIVAVEASPRFVAIVYTEDDGRDAHCPKVLALRIDRTTLAESVVVLSEGRCGHEVGPFFTSARGDDVAIAWPERSGGEGKARAPVVALAHVRLTPEAKPALGRIERRAETVVDAGCTARGCAAVALVDGAPVVLPYSEGQ